MLSRRQLRIKVLQALYAFSQSGDDRINIGEKQMFTSIEKLYDLCFWQLSILEEIVDFAKIRIEESKHKHFPTPEDLNPNTKFVENTFIEKLSANRVYRKIVDKLKINWIDERELIRKIYIQIKNSQEYKLYLDSKEKSYEEDREIIIKLFKKHVTKLDSLESFYEDKCIYWTDDYHTANSLTIKIMNAIEEKSDEFQTLPSILKSQNEPDNEDKEFVLGLYRKSILNSEKLEKRIAEKAVNWEFDRIAAMDILILKMALTEIIEFSSIPVKVTMNEYIEIAKMYSTPKSSIFVNGILDKLVAEMSRNEEIKKSGRGLIT